MRRSSVYLIGLVVAVAIIYGTNEVITRAANGSVSSASGSVNDPLITKSYLDQQLAGLVEAEVARQLAAGDFQTGRPGAGEDAELVVVQLHVGQTLYAMAGTEFIVRTGSTVAVSTDSNGIPDVTAGLDVAAGAPIQLNHLLVFPREGRGIKPAEQTDLIYVMVRGGYTLVDAEGNVLNP